jgi:hypothetical protein
MKNSNRYFLVLLCFFLLNNVYSFKNLNSLRTLKTIPLSLSEELPQLEIIQEQVSIPIKSFEAQLSPEILVSMSIVSLILLITTGFWWSTIIPQVFNQFYLFFRINK